MAQTESRIDGRSSEEIRRNIQQGRREMDATLDDLGGRLHPRNLLGDVMDLFRTPQDRSATASHARGMGQDVVRIIRHNPGPALLVAAGAAWAIYNTTSGDRDRSRRRQYRDEYYPDEYASARLGVPVYAEAEWGESGQQSATDRVSSKAGELGDRARGEASEFSAKARDTARHLGESAGETAEAAKARMEDLRHRASDSVQHYAGEARHRASRRYDDANRRFQHAVDDSPLLVATGFLAAGLLAGIALPHTRKEDRWMGETSDELKEQAWRQGKDLAERAGDTAAAAASRAGEEARKEGIHPGQLAEKAGNVANRTGQSASDAAREEGVHPKTLWDKGARVADAGMSEARKEAERHKDEKANEAGRHT